jgi:Spy/CpxP family protein refolding chaperone
VAPAQSAPSEPAPSQAAPSQASPSQAAPDRAGAAAQAAPGHAQAQEHTDEDNPLNLTDHQKAKLRPILMEENQQLETLRNDTSMTQEQKIAKSNEIRQNASPKIRAILTPEQLQELADLQQKARQQQNQGPPANAAPAPQK